MHALTTLEQRYRKLLETPSDIQGHLQTLYDMVVEHDMRHVIELGVRSGNSSVALLYGLEQTGGRLTSVDLEQHPDIGGPWPHWRFVRGNDLDPLIVAQLPQADMVFLDTSHYYDQTLAELNVYQHLVERPGFIVCHDTELEHADHAPPIPRWPVKTAITEFCQQNTYRWSNQTHSWGLAIIEVN